MILPIIRASSTPFKGIMGLWLKARVDVDRVHGLGLEEFRDSPTYNAQFPEFSTTWTPKDLPSQGSLIMISLCKTMEKVGYLGSRNTSK